jgi:XTP/dITP diphosphohydrolase
MSSLRQLVLASGNAGKLKEMQALLAPLGVQLLSQSQLGIAGAEEPHLTFLENALAKARHAASQSGLPALADDSGLCCQALQGLPGVRSARFAGEQATDAQNNQALLTQLQGASNRHAHFCCVIVAVRTPHDPEPLIAEGRWEGLILEQEAGQQGFGYDPLFWVQAVGMTAAQMPHAQKNQLSHRAQAVGQLRQLMQARWAW